jgi:BirA family transcriptional regulator, biotin operon repressor / biotin---[acetyl-CoA-carboxylase] ligase
MSDDLTEARLATRLTTRWLGRTYEWHDECGSTNDLAAVRAREGAPEGLVVATDVQTAGRGRLGRVWHSPAGESLYFSILLRPARTAAEIPPITLLAGAAVAEALAGLGLEPRLKWPNDVQLAVDGEARKVAGILTEMSSEGARASHVVVGIGLNVNATAFPPELASRATSLRLVAGRAFDRAAVLAAVLAAFEPMVESFAALGPAAASAAWGRFASLGARIRVAAPGGPGSHLEGVALGVDADGALRLRDDAGRVHRVLSGEITT